MMPQPGYIHVDSNPWARELHIWAHGDSIPLRKAWVDEILSIHMVEHVPPDRLVETLRHWQDLLVPGGSLTVHTPNAEALGRTLVSADTVWETFWAAQSAMFGYGPGPDECEGPHSLRGRGDHRLLLTFPVLSRVLGMAGFCDVEDVSHKESCYHAEVWDRRIPGLCLAVRAWKAPTKDMP